MSNRLHQVASTADEVGHSHAVPQIRFRSGGIRFQLVEIGTILGDFLLILAASLIAGVSYQWLFLDTTGSVETFAALGVLVFVNFLALNSAQQNYRPKNLINAGRQIRYMTLNWLFVFFFLAAVAFSLKITSAFSRGSTILFFASGLIVLAAMRLLLSRSLKKALSAGAFAEQRVVLIAERGLYSASSAFEELKRCGYSAVNSYELTATEAESAGVSPTLRGKLDAVIAACQNDKIDHIFLLLKWNRPQLIKNVAQMLRTLPIPVHLIPDENVAGFLAGRRGDIGTTFTVELQRAPLTDQERAVKRVFDVCSAVAILVLLCPLMLLTALMIKLDSPGPVFFKQRRNGFNGRIFSIYKFRSMSVLEDGEVIRQASKDDPRVTRIGRWLRKTSIDELPQLINVLVGDMSLVGPRPHAVAHNSEYQSILANYAFRHHVKPGITGWAQVNGLRGETATVLKMKQRVDHDLWYINHWSLWLDLRILVQTVVTTMRQPPAY